jgi:hypothetical protein
MLTSNISIFDVFYVRNGERTFLRSIRSAAPHEAKSTVWEQYRSELLAKNAKADIGHLEVEMRLSGTHNKG